MDLLDIYANLSLNSSNYDSGLSDARHAADQFASDVTNSIEEVAQAYADLVSGSVRSYGTYEQMIGGVTHLFGEDADIVINNAQRAVDTAQMSANDYLNTATRISGSLLRNLGGDTETAAYLIDMAMQDAADNVNMFGSDMQFVLRAYEGFGRQTFTMLDNMRLGYGGTKHEAREMLYDAKKLTEQYEELSDIDLSNLSETYDEKDFSMLTMDNIIKAIHVMQEFQNITGISLEEGATTIEGTMRRTKSAWDNLQVALSGGMDMDEAVDTLVDSIFGENEGEGLLNQIIPRISTTIEGISKFLEKAGPILEEKLPEIFEQLKPSLESIVDSLGKQLTVLLPSLVDLLWPVISDILSQITDLVTEKMHEKGGIFEDIANVIDWVREHGNQLPGIIAEIWNSIVALGIASEVTRFFNLISNTFNRTTLIVMAVGALIGLIVMYRGELQALFSGIGSYIETTVEILRIQFENFQLWIQNMNWAALFATIADEVMLGIANMINAGLQMITDAINNILSQIDIDLGFFSFHGSEHQIEAPQLDTSELEKDLETYRELVHQGKDPAIRAQIDENNAILDELAKQRDEIKFWTDDTRSLSERATDTFGDMLQGLGFNTGFFDVQKLKEDSQEFEQTADIIEGKWQELNDTAKEHPEFKVTLDADKAIEGLNTLTVSRPSDELGITDPLAGVRETIETADFTEETAQAGSKISSGIASGIEQNMSLLSDAGANSGTAVSNGITPYIDLSRTWGNDLMSNFIAGITDKIPELESAVSQAAGTVDQYMGFSEPEKGPLSNFHTFAPDMMNLFAQGIRDSQRMLEDTMTNAFDFSGQMGSANMTPVSPASPVGLGGMTINVYGTQGMDEQTLAKLVADRVRDQVVSIGAIA